MIKEEAIKREMENKPRFWWHWQNLYKEKHPTTILSGLRHGRGWIHDRRDRLEFHAEWQVPTEFCQLRVTIEDREIDFALGCGLFALWLGFEGVRWIHRSDYHKREISVNISHSSIHWKLWTDPDEWHTKTPKWRDGWFNPINFLLGNQKHSEINQGSKDIVISMPEGDYPAVLTHSTSIWKRPRWPIIKRIEYTEIEVEKGVPIPGKGENSWDCDDDAIFSLSTACTSEQIAIDRFIDSVNKTRQRYGGKNWKPPTISNEKQ